MNKGRPSKYNPKHCKVVIDLMTEGYSKEVVAAELGISRDTLYEWCRRYPDFSDTIKRGELLSQRYWEKIGMDGIMGKIPGFKVAIWIFMMKTRFGWSDIPIVKDEPTTQQIIENPDEELKRLMDKYGNHPVKRAMLFGS